MNERLTQRGYEQSRSKLAQLERRLDAINTRTDLNADHAAEVRRSYKMMIRQYRRDIKLYEAAASNSRADHVADS